ncbi:hypothetical protein C8R44DRAFT_747686 [Mycena epipterygia]|nr:hypothetical protein C8R44DRAFT_747686 [Mycena epipterygia]
MSSTPARSKRGRPRKATTTAPKTGPMGLATRKQPVRPPERTPSTNPPKAPNRRRHRHLRPGPVPKTKAPRPGRMKGRRKRRRWRAGDRKGRKKRGRETRGGEEEEEEGSGDDEAEVLCKIKMEAWDAGFAAREQLLEDELDFGGEDDDDVDLRIPRTISPELDVSRSMPKQSSPIEERQQRGRPARSRSPVRKQTKKAAPVPRGLVRKRTTTEEGPARTPKPLAKKPRKAAVAMVEEMDAVMRSAMPKGKGKKKQECRVSFTAPPSPITPATSSVGTPYDKHFPALSSSPHQRKTPNRSPMDGIEFDEEAGKVTLSREAFAGLLASSSTQNMANLTSGGLVRRAQRGTASVPESGGVTPELGRGEASVPVDGQHACSRPAHHGERAKHQGKLRSGLNVFFPLSDLTAENCLHSNRDREARRRCPLLDAGFPVEKDLDKSSLSPADFIMAGERLVDAVGEFFEPCDKAKQFTNQLAKHFKRSRTRADFHTYFHRYRTYNTELLKAFVQEPFNMKKWQAEVYDDIVQRDRDNMIHFDICRQHRTPLPVRQRPVGHRTSPPDGKHWFRNDSPHGHTDSRRGFRNDSPNGREQVDQQKQKSKPPKLKAPSSERCMYCAARNVHDARECPAPKGKWCIRLKNDMFAPLINTLRICWAYNGAAGCPSSCKAETEAARTQRSTALPAELFPIVTPLKADRWEHWIAKAGLTDEFADIPEGPERPQPPSSPTI